MAVLVGGVGQLFQGDLDVGRLAVEWLAKPPHGLDVPADLYVEDLHYGAVAVTQRIEELGVSTLVLVGAAGRGRPAGTVERRRIREVALAAEQAQQAVADAATGYVTLDLVLHVSAAFGVLPARTVVVEVEPATTALAERLSPPVQAALPHAVGLVQAELRRLPVLELADRIRALCANGRLEFAPAVETVRALLRELTRLDDEGRWGATFQLRDRLRRDIAEGRTGFGMDHLDWGLWWALIEELDRLQPLEATSAGVD